MKTSSIIQLSLGGLAAFLTACTGLESLDVGNIFGGGECTQTYNCQAGFTCEDGICVKIARSQFSIFYTASCDKDSDCCSDADAGGSCSEIDGLYCGTQKRCSTYAGGDEGDPCSLDVDCKNGLICHGDTAVCTLVHGDKSGSKNLDEACDSINDCRRPYICSTISNNPTCVKIPFFAGADCTESDKEAGAFRIYYEVPAYLDGHTDKGDFYRHPFPSDVRLTESGKIYLDDHPSPGEALGIDVAGQYIKAAKEVVKGFALNQPVFFRSTDALKKSSLCLDNGSVYPELSDGDTDIFCEKGGQPSIYLVNIDEHSANYGKHLPVELKIERKASQFICQNSLAIAPLPGRPLEPKTIYAAIITSDIRSIGNNAPIQDRDFYNVMHPAPQVTNDKEAKTMQPLIAWLEKSRISVDSIAAATVFTTGEPAAIGQTLYNTIQAMPAPTFNNDAVLCADENTSHFCHGNLASRKCGSDSRFYEIHGSYTAPAFQSGTRPYLINGGRFNYDNQGKLQKFADETMCYSLTIPKDADLSKKLPVIVYAHGTGGNYKSFVTDSLVGIYTSLGFAVISFDNVMHGPRQDPNFDHTKWTPALWNDDKAGNYFFNPMNPQASRDNILQGGADLISLVRLVANAPEQTVDTLTFSFDPDNIIYLGHSQGTTINGPFLANDTTIKAAVLSGAGAELAISILHKKKPMNIGNTMANLFGDQNLSHIHPIMGILSMLFGEVDTLSYADQFVVNDTRKLHPRPLVMFSGIDDSYSPNEAQASQIKAMHIPLIGPKLLPELLDGVETVSGPVTATTINGQAVNVPAAVIQYQPSPGEDGHFVLFNDDGAKTVLKHFLQTTLTGSSEIAK